MHRAGIFSIGQALGRHAPQGLFFNLPAFPPINHSMKKKTGQPQKKGSGGRRTLYKPALAKAARELKENGATNKQIAAALHLSEASIYEYQNKFSEFAEALKRGQDAAIAIVEGAVFREAQGYNVEEVRESWVVERDKDGKETRKLVGYDKVRRWHRGNPTAAALFLNARNPEVYQRRPEDGQGRVAQINFNFTVINADGKEQRVECKDFLAPKIIQAKTTPAKPPAK